MAHVLLVGSGSEQCARLRGFEEQELERNFTVESVKPLKLEKGMNGDVLVAYDSMALGGRVIEGALHVAEAIWNKIGNILPTVIVKIEGGFIKVKVDKTFSVADQNKRILEVVREVLDEVK